MGHIIICTRCFAESSFRMLLTCKTGGECPWSPNTISSVDDFRTELTELTKLALQMEYDKTNYFFKKVSFNFNMSGDDHSFFSMFITYLLDDFADSMLPYPPSTSVPPSSNSPNSVFLRILGPVWNLTVYLKYLVLLAI